MLTHHFETPIKPRRVVVIGAGGFVGGAVVKALNATGIAVSGLTRREVDLRACDGAERLGHILRPEDAVVFVSAITPAKNTEQLMANLSMAQTAARALAARRPAHLLYISSDAVYADEAKPVTEASSLSPSTMHGLMHKAREMIFYAEYNGPLAFLRPTLIYGAADPHSGYGPNRFRRQAAAGEPITIFGDGEEQRDHVAVEDVARLAVRIVMNRSSGALNAATGVSTSFRQIAELVAVQFKPHAQVKSVPRPGPRPHLLHRFFDITTCHKVFPDFHFEPLVEGLARVHRERLAKRA